jgi:hypothetical protein
VRFQAQAAKPDHRLLPMARKSIKATAPKPFNY